MADSPAETAAPEDPRGTEKPRAEPAPKGGRSLSYRLKRLPPADGDSIRLSSFVSRSTGQELTAREVQVLTRTAASFFAPKDVGINVFNYVPNYMTLAVTGMSCASCVGRMARAAIVRWPEDGLW
mgnify:CR=1 FL=1